jgi:diguanylate cyclase (GGDEF)-like protein
MTRHGQQLAVLFVDLDRFKLINDTLGHAVGDHALIHAARRLAGVLRASDTVARLGGDEFAVILPELDDGAQAMQVAGKIVEALGVPEEIRGHRLHLGCSVGVAVFPEHGASGEELVRHADLAMYQAKQAGGSRACLFSSELNTYAEEILALDGDLRDALGRGELFLHFQPQSAPLGARLRGVEALVRWRHPRFGVLAPDRFIPVAETRGLIVELGRQVLDMALAQLVDWDAAGLRVPRIAVNVSAAELSPGFAAVVEAALARHGVAAERLELEITESALTSDGIGTLAVLTRLRDHGVGITVDDFGVGYSSLGQLRRLPIDCLKIDRSFVEEIDSCSEDAAIVTAIVAMAGALGLRTVAEGVERAAQIGVLETIGCESIQGYLLARPMAAADFAAWARGFADAAAPA